MFLKQKTIKDDKKKNKTPEKRKTNAKGLNSNVKQRLNRSAVK